MRFVFSNLAVIATGLLVMVSMGCNADPNCRRETALLRAEILDLEDRNAILRSRYESAATELSSYTGKPVDLTGINSTGNYDAVIIEDFAPGQTIYSDDIILSEGEYLDGTIITEYPAENMTAPSVAPAMTAPTLADPATQTPLGNQPENLPRAKTNAAGESTGASGSLPIPEQQNNQGRGISRNRYGARATGRRIATTRSVTSPQATEITINRNATRGHDVDNQPGDEGISLLIQPKNSQQRIVLQTGELTVSIIDPKAEPGTQRLGRWKFLPEETELFFVNDEIASHGILLNLPWELATPTQPRLIVHVRFITEDGRVLQTSGQVRVSPPGPDYSPDAPAVVAWTQQDWRSSIASSPSIELEGDDFDLASIENSLDERADANDRRNSDWRRSRSSANASSALTSSFRKRRIPAQPASRKRAEPPKPEWRPVR